MSKDLIGPSLVEAEEWYWILESELYGAEEFGPYASFREAQLGITRVMNAGLKLQDGVERTYSQPYQKSEVSLT